MARATPLSWTSVAGATSYELQRSFNSGSFGPQYTGPLTSASYKLRGGAHHYRVRACDGGSCSAYSATHTVQVVLDQRGGSAARGGAVSAAVRWLAAIVLALGLAPLAQAQTTVRYVHTDGLGSVVAMTDESRAVVERREYEPYGQQLTALEDGPGYTGHVQDAATGLVYMQQRYYDQGVGRFLSVDPVGPLHDPLKHFGRYHYANSNPYRFLDPDGRSSCTKNPEAALMCASPETAGGITNTAGQSSGAPGFWAGILTALGITTAQNQSGEGAGDSPPAPGELVGEQDSKSGPQGNRHNSGPLSGENGGTGNAETDFYNLTGGNSAPASEGDRLPPGSQVGENGVIIRPGSSSSGPRIDIPANGEKPHETLHYPKPPPPAQ